MDSSRIYNTQILSKPSKHSKTGTPGASSGMDHLVTQHPTDEYGWFQARGRRLQEWMDEPRHPGAEPCPFGHTGLRASDLLFQDPMAAGWGLDDSAWRKGQRLGLLNAANLNITPIVMADALPVALSTNSWVGAVEEGAIWIHSIFRQDGPPMSEVTRAIYESCYDADSLNHIIVLGIINATTRAFITGVLLQGNWPDQRADPRDVWEWGTPQYQTLLGLPFGTLVAAYLIASFPRGTVRVARIHTWMDPVHTINMRFDIEHTLDKTTRDYMAGVYENEEMPDVSDGSRAPSTIEDTEMPDVSEFDDLPSDPPVEPAAYFISGQKVSVSQGKRGVGLSPGDERTTKNTKV